MGAQELCICYRTLLQHTTPSSCHHAGDEGDEGHEGNEGHEEGHEASRNEGCRRGGTSDEGHESHEGNEGHEEGYEGHESHEGNEGHEEVNGCKCVSLLLLGSGHERCLPSSCGGVPRLALLY